VNKAYCPGRARLLLIALFLLSLPVVFLPAAWLPSVVITVIHDGVSGLADMPVQELVFPGPPRWLDPRRDVFALTRADDREPGLDRGGPVVC
jgi:hypothetical protein